MISFLTPLATSGISYTYGFVFVATNIAGVLVVYFFLYESVSLSLENVDAMYGQPHVRPWTSHKWLPEGYLTRMKRDEDFFKTRTNSSRGPGTSAEYEFKEHNAANHAEHANTANGNGNEKINRAV